MEKRSLTTTITRYPNVVELPTPIQELMKQAVQARANAYAPYSGFAVGAAVLLENGIVVTGNNQENAAYPSGLCAERVAIFQAGAQYPNVRILAVAVCAASQSKPIDQPIPPCGACRQSMAEYEHRQQQPIAVYFMGHSGAVEQVESVTALLPLLFNGGHL